MIIISPTKTMNESREGSKDLNVLYEDKTLNLLRTLQRIDINTLAKEMKIKNDTLDKTYYYYNEFEDEPSDYAINKYNGLSFRQLGSTQELIDNYGEYLENYVYILSSFYGIINSVHSIKNYRLDFTHSKLFEVNLYKYWQEDIKDMIEKKKPKQILNLASNEYYKLLSKEVIENYSVINLLPKEKISSANMKKIRGQILKHCIINEIKDYTNIKEVKLENVNIIKVVGNKMHIKEVR